MPYSGAPDNPIDEVRFLIGDTNTVTELFSDGDVVYALEKKGQVPKAAAAMLARQLAVSLPLRFTGYQLADYKDPDGSKMAEAYRAMAARLEAELVAAGGITGEGVYAGGISVSDKEMVAANADRVKPAFARQMTDYDGPDVVE